MHTKTMRTTEINGVRHLVRQVDFRSQEALVALPTSYQNLRITTVHEWKWVSLAGLKIEDSRLTQAFVDQVVRAGAAEVARLAGKKVEIVSGQRCQKYVIR